MLARIGMLTALYFSRGYTSILSYDGLNYSPLSVPHIFAPNDRESYCLIILFIIRTKSLKAKNIVDHDSFAANINYASLSLSISRHW